MSSDPAWLDTNMVVRYLLGEPVEHAEIATKIIEEGAEVLLSPVVLVECFFVLLSVYRLTRAEIVDSLVELLDRKNIRVPSIDKALAQEALRMCRDSGRVKPADALLWAEARASGILDIYTFDRKFPQRGVILHATL